MRKTYLISCHFNLVLFRAKHGLAATRRLQDGCHDGCEKLPIQGKQELVYSNNSSDTLKKYIIICLIMHSSLEARWMRDYTASKILTVEW
jgi:hypothetical protein